MTLPFPSHTAVECFKGDSASEAPYWTRLAVPDGLPIFQDDRPWAEAVMAHYNPRTRRCFAVALGREDMIGPFLERYPDGIGSGGPNDEDWAREINPIREMDLALAEGLLVLNGLPGDADDPVDLYGDDAGTDTPDVIPPGSGGSPCATEGTVDPTREIQEASGGGTLTPDEDEPGEPGAPESGASATEPGTGGSASPSETESPPTAGESSTEEASADAAGPTISAAETP